MAERGGLSGRWCAGAAVCRMDIDQEEVMTMRKRFTPMRATCFGGCGNTVSDENQVCDSCNEGPK